jgi:hypothetical protein
MPRVAFDPPPGLNSNDTIYAVPGAWATATNMRWEDNRAQTVGGYTKTFASALTGSCRNVFNWSNNTGKANIAFGTHSKLYVYVDGALADITPAGLAAGSSSTGGQGSAYGMGTYGGGYYSVPASQYKLRTWSLGAWGQTLLASPRFQTLYQWSNDPGTIAQEITQAPDTIAAMRVNSKTRQAIAFGCNEELTGNYNPLAIRWCKSEDLTIWTTAADNNAGEYILSGGGQIVTGEQVGDVHGVWTDKDLYQMLYVGDPGQTYQFDIVDTNCGIAGPNAVCVMGGVAYFLGKDKRIRAWGGYGTKPVVIDCPIWKDFADNIVDLQIDKVVLSSNTKFGEIWLFYPDTRDGTENSRAIFFKIAGQGVLWSKSDFARSAFCDSGVLSYPIGVTPAGVVHNHEYGATADGSSLSWSIKSAAQYLNEAEQTLQVQRIRPDFKGQTANITLTAYVRAHPQSSATTKGPYTLATSTVKKDIRFTGAIAELEWAGTGYARFGKPTFDAIGAGSR